MTITPPISKDTGPLDWRIAIVDKSGRPTPEFQRRWATQRTNNGLIGFVGIGSGMPTGTPDGDGEVYIDISTTPPTLYVADGGNWEVVGVVNFTDLQDVPHAYTASAEELVRVKSTTDGLEFASISTVLDTIGSNQGDILYRSATGWVPLSPGTAGWILETTGGASNPQWSDISNILDNLGVAQGDVIYRGASGWTVLSPGTSGDVLTTGGSGADPSWAPASGGGATGANPTATASDTVVNGTATTFMRSDGSPPVQKASSSQFGLVKVDGTTITSSGGVISASGGGGGGGGWVLLETQSASNSASLDFTSSISSTYDNYVILIEDILPVNGNNNLEMRLSINGGSTYDGSTVYDYAETYQLAQGSTGNNAATNTNQFNIAGTNVSNGTLGVKSVIWLFNPGNTALNKSITLQSSWWHDGANALISFSGSGKYSNNSAVNAFTFFMSSGNIASGIIKCYGIP